MKHKVDSNAVFAAILAVLTILTVIIQIESSSQSTTRLETTLFSILQFVFSLGFAWVLARISLKSEFAQSQKQFAISAFRRINEISSGVKRLLARTRSSQPTATAETRHELEIIQAIATSVSDSIDSSIADWADIIGAELATLDKIETLKTEDSSVSVVDHLIPADHIKTKPEKLDSLIKSLPLQLQAVARADQKQEAAEGARILDKERARKGVVVLPGFWDDTFARDIWDLAVGDQLMVRIGDVDSRRSCLIVYDDQNRPVGVITNRLATSYICFAESVIRHAGKSQFSVELTEINRTTNSEGRHYFKVNIIEYDPIFASAVKFKSPSAKKGQPVEPEKHTEPGT